jgi:hypothetical protein
VPFYISDTFSSPAMHLPYVTGKERMVFSNEHLGLLDQQNLTLVLVFWNHKYVAMFVSLQVQKSYSSCGMTHYSIISNSSL